jgi:acetyl esterase/lipase
MMVSSESRWVVLVTILWLGIVLCNPMSIAAQEDVIGLPLLVQEDFEKDFSRWETTDAASWERLDRGGNHSFGNNKRISNYQPKVRSPHNIALLRDVKVGDFTLVFKVRSTQDTGGHRDCCIFFGHQDSEHFYYIHLGAKPDPASGQVMIVNGEPRKPITENKKEVPWDDKWHTVKVVRNLASGSIEVYFDDMKTPHMTANDKTFSAGRIGIGSFDDMNEFDDIRLYAANDKVVSKSPPAEAKKPPARPEPTVKDYAYGTASERQKFDFWKAESSLPTPVVLLIHGGGWVNGDKTGYGNSAIKAYLQAGISVAAVNYRFIAQAMEQNVSPPVKAPLEDAARALQTIRSKAKEWNIDPARIGATGGSAGACTSLWLALHDDLANPNSDDPIARESSKLQCAAVTGAQTSLDPNQLREWMSNAIYGGHAFGFAQKGRSRAEEFELLMKNRDEVKHWFAEYSPIELVNAGDPPIFLEYPNQKTPPVVGGKEPDPTHSAIYGIKLVEKCKEAGVTCELVYPGYTNSDFKNASEFLIHHLKKDE